MIIRASKLIGNEIEGGIITGALFCTAKEDRRIFGDLNSFHVDNMGGGYIKSTDDMVYFQNEVNFTEATVSGLKLGVEDFIENLGETIRELRNDVASLRGDMYDDVIVNATFDLLSKNFH
ncbi:hypothetical protein [Paenibacillus sp. BT-177]|uniref:hypothetical protein n=1 Tax=Paenibacillus sp. BT-177 TaxID=2986930 RepID=UPI0021F769CA|nr:hypothetical protein [Paenibacillus sp. BT-177]